MAIKSKEEFRVLLVYPNLPLMLVPPLAIALFTKILKDQGYIVDLFDTTSYVSEDRSSPQNRVKFLQARNFDESKDMGVVIKDDMMGDFRKKVEDFKPDFIAYSVVEDAFVKTLRLMRTIEDVCVPHLLGGVFPTAAPKVCIESDEINMVAIGEGETTIVAVSEAVRLGKPLDNIPGTWFKNTEGEVSKNAAPPLVDINDFEADYSLFAKERFYRPMGGKIFFSFPVETYRGCPYKCTYCNSPMQADMTKATGLGNFLRRKSMDTLRSEFRDLVDQYNPEFVYFTDDSFLARPKSEIFEFCDMYEEFKIPFWFNTRVENCFEEHLKRLKEVGCYRIAFGIECGNDQYREKVLKRNVTNETLLNKFEIIANSGIAFSVNLILGMPGETRELIFDTIRLVSQIVGYDAMTVSVFTPYHGTVLRNVAINNGWLDPNSITKHTTSSSMLNMPPPFINAEEIDKLMRVVPLYCYFPESEWPRLQRAETDDEEGNKILAEYAAIYQRDFLKGNQDDEKVWLVEGGTGCKSNPKDSYQFTPARLSDDQLAMLIV